MMIAFEVAAALATVSTIVTIAVVIITLELQ